MNDKNRKQDAGNNGDLNPAANEAVDAFVDAFVEALESEARLAGSLDEESQSVFQFGAAIRESAMYDLPAGNIELREQLIAKLEGEPGGADNVTKLATKKTSKDRTQATTRRVALAASLLLAIGLLTLFLLPFGDSPLAIRTDSAESSSLEPNINLQGGNDYVAENGSASVANDASASKENPDSTLGESLSEWTDTDDGLSVKDELVSQFGLHDQQPANPTSPADKTKIPNGTEEVDYLSKSQQGAGSGQNVFHELADVPNSGAANAPTTASTPSLWALNKRRVPGDVDKFDARGFELQSLDVESAYKVAPQTVSPPSPSPNAGASFGGGGGGLGGHGGGLGGNSSDYYRNDVAGGTVYGGAAPGGRSSGKAGMPARGGEVRVLEDQSFELARQYGETLKSRTELESTSRYSTYWYSDADSKHRFRRRWGGRGFGNEQYDPIYENKFVKVAGNSALSTFSIDVDTASYANVRRFLNNHQRPPVNSVRIEELVNYFDYNYPQPEGEHPFSVNMELASCPWNEKNHLLRVGLKGKEMRRDERSPSNLVFLLDVSGSMQSADKLPLLKKGLLMMVQRLSENDAVSIVTYAGNAGVVLEPTNGANKRQIEKAIEQLSAGGSTNGSAGIDLAYRLAQKKFIKDGSNRVILATDGDLNVGITNDNALVGLIKQKASEGVFLTVLGFGTGNLKDSKLEKLADNGNGMYAYIDNMREAHKVLIEQMSGSLETIAKDVKLQVEFNPNEVVAYRLIGYENRVLAAQDFDNDKKDAGEIGAGHTVTALYELVLAGGTGASTSLQRPLKYQTSGQPSEPAAANVTPEGDHDGELLTLSLRYKQPSAQTSQKLEVTLRDEPKSFSSASNDFQFAASVASFGMILRNSQYRGSTSLEWVQTTAARSVGVDDGGYRSEFLDLVHRAGQAR